MDRKRKDKGRRKDAGIQSTLTPALGKRGKAYLKLPGSKDG